jgi:hypothetical protein
VGLYDVILEGMTFLESIIIIVLIMWHTQKVLELAYGQKKETAPEPASEAGETKTSNRAETKPRGRVGQDR